jgi:hypothetical protein
MTVRHQAHHDPDRYRYLAHGTVLRRDADSKPSRYRPRFGG